MFDIVLDVVTLCLAGRAVWMLATIKSEISHIQKDFRKLTDRVKILEKHNSITLCH